MPSPFPGMNPYIELEEVWHDFHERWIPYAAAMLGPQVQPRYIVKLDEHVYIHELPAEERRLIGKSDLSVAREPQAPAEVSGIGSVVAPAYARVPLAIEEERLSFIEIRDRQSFAVVTVIELLSPSNKSSDRPQYLAKRAQRLQHGLRLVEIDLLRGGQRLPLDEMPPCDYYAMAARPEEIPRVRVWPIGLRDPLPKIAVPLPEIDADVQLDLQSLLHRVYDDAFYGSYVYRTPPVPPLGSEDTLWAKQFVPPSK